MKAFSDRPSEPREVAKTLGENANDDGRIDASVVTDGVSTTPSGPAEMKRALLAAAPLALGSIVADRHVIASALVARLSSVDARLSTADCRLFSRLATPDCRLLTHD